MEMMNCIFICMLGFIMIAAHFIASHSLNSRTIPKYDKGSGEPVRPVDYEENTGN
jgi:hypothetical protein